MYKRKATHQMNTLFCGHMSSDVFRTYPRGYGWDIEEIYYMTKRDQRAKLRKEIRAKLNELRKEL